MVWAPGKLVGKAYFGLRDAIYNSRLFPLMMRIPFAPIASRLRAASTNFPGASFRLGNEYRVLQAGSNGRRYVVSADINEIYSGLGCCLLALGPSWKYARATGRALVIDWRGNPYTRSSQENLFSRLFEQPEQETIGVPCICDDSVNTLELPQPILGPSKEFVHESGHSVKLPFRGLDCNDLRRILRDGLDVDFATVIPSLSATFQLATASNPPALTFEEGQQLYRSLKLQPCWAERVSTFYEDHMARWPTIGVHVRHGNGEQSSRDHFGPRQIREFSSFVETLKEKIRRLASSRFGQRYTVFLCTDSEDVVNAMGNGFESFVTRQMWRPASGDGIDFDHAHKRPGGGIESAANAMIDMHLLAKCDAVMMTRPTAFAGHVPYIMEKPRSIVLDHKATAGV